MLAGRAAKVAWLPDSISSLKGKNPTLRQKLQRGLDQLTRTRDQAFLDTTCRQLDEQQTDVLIAYWGTGPLADITAIKRLRPRVKIVLMVLCFPLALETLGVYRQHFLMRRVAPSLSGIMYSNRAMQEYFRQHVFGARGAHLREVIVKPCWPERYQQAAIRRPEPMDRANLIYVGRTDLSHHTVHAADDLRPMMGDILANNIELHHARSKETADGHPFRRPFEPLDQAGLIAKMGAHDASLIAYNTDACSRTERFLLTVPDRLLTSVAAGVPIAIPKRGYTGSKQYLEDYAAVFEFESLTHLKHQLDDRDRVRGMRDAAWTARTRYTAEAQGAGFAEYLTSL